MSATVYRMYDEDGRLLYVGCSAALPARLMEHAAQRPWWTEVCAVAVEHFGTIDEAFVAEGRVVDRVLSGLRQPAVGDRIRGRTSDAEKASVAADPRRAGIAHYHCASCGHEWTRKL